jgi:hypothetical protein
MKKTTTKPARTLSLTPETIRVIHASELTDVGGGRMAETKWTYCGQGGPTECYKPNPY